MDRLEEQEPHTGGPLQEHQARVRGQQIENLRWHWGEAYKITWAEGAFRATRRDTGAEVSAGTAAEVHQLIRDDYSANPVPRDVAADE
ncbi:MAG TPA: hypothetical protein VGS19_01040 [Streptosporangiaceae bacterium]|nr:hypothetical protein [Streptosporangiaceae bacterium]